MFSIDVAMFTMTNPPRNLTTGPRVPRQRFHAQVRRTQSPNALRSNALPLLGALRRDLNTFDFGLTCSDLRHVLRANVQRRSSRRFNDLVNDWNFISLSFNDRFGEYVSVSIIIGS